ncbi:hypothetical protein ACNFIC_02590 [Pseudomonas sp. NY15463]|uniref:hypothetical protein n=1 Tax=Pseudomonas sp. NY15463 TaxID=3400361 RepID=UPI003A8B3BE8
MAMLVACIAGFFFVGVVWRPAFGSLGHLKYALECTSYIATTLAAAVAILALNAWRYQFKHTERFKCLSELKEAAADLNAYMEYLHDYYSACFNSIPNGGTLAWKHSPDGSLAQWDKAIDRYKRVWTTARIFLAKAEIDGFSGKPEDFDDLYRRNSVLLPASLVGSNGSQMLTNLMECYQEAHQESWALYKSTLKQTEDLLKKSR